MPELKRGGDGWEVVVYCPMDSTDLVPPLPLKRSVMSGELDSGCLGAALYCMMLSLVFRRPPAQQEACRLQNV